MASHDRLTKQQILCGTSDQAANSISIVTHVLISNTRHERPFLERTSVIFRSNQGRKKTSENLTCQKYNLGFLVDLELFSFEKRNSNDFSDILAVIYTLQDWPEGWRKMDSYLLWWRRSDIVAFIVIRVLEKALSGGWMIPWRSTGGTGSIGTLHRQESTKQIPSQVWLPTQNTFQFTFSHFSNTQLSNLWRNDILSQV